jgi:hypothetical protein
MLGKSSWKDILESEEARIIRESAERNYKIGRNGRHEKFKTSNVIPVDEEMTSIIYMDDSIQATPSFQVQPYSKYLKARDDFISQTPMYSIWENSYI